MGVLHHAKTEGFRLCLLHLVGQLQAAQAARSRRLATMATAQTRKDSGPKVEGFRLLAGDKLSQKRDIKQASWARSNSHDYSSV